MLIALALLRYLARTPWSTAMAVTGMALGVTSIVSVHLVSASISTRLDSLVPAELADYSHYLHRDNLEATDYFALRRLWRAGSLPGVERLSPLVDETTELEGQSVRVIGTDLLSSQPSASARSTTEQFSWNGVWIDSSLEAQLSLPVNGIIDAPEGTLLADISTAHDLLHWPASRLSYIGLVISDAFGEVKKTAEKLLPGFGAGFPSTKPALELSAEWQLIGIAEQYPAREFGKSILFNIAALGMLALLVAWLLIYQVAVSWLRRFWPVFERLHVLGVEWQQLRLYFLLAIGLVATIAAGIGLAAGWWLASGLLAVALPGEPVNLQMDGWVILKALGSALAVCLPGGAWAFYQSQRESESGNRSFLLTCLLLLAAGWCVVEPATGLAGGFFAIAVLSLAASQAIAPVVDRLKRGASLIRGSYLLRVAIREALWHPGELSVALAGLALAVATAIGVSLMVDSFRLDFSQMLDHRLKYDVIAEGEATALNAIADADSTAATRLQVYRQGNIRVNGISAELNVTRMDAFEASRYGFNRELEDREVLLSEQAGRALQRSVGDSLSVSGTPMTVAGLFSAFGDLQPRLIIDDRNPLAASAAAELTVTSVGFMSNSPDALIATLRRDHPGLELRLQSDIRRIALDAFDQTFAITT
ncbi:MAG: ABC transporter permease, partial [Proteobacteria bacterium]|nr:ABC transporter permease [Pseudomonadota bacterium]